MVISFFQADVRHARIECADHRRQCGHDHREPEPVDVGRALPERVDVPPHRIALEVHRVRSERIRVVLGDDPTTVAVDRIGSIDVVATMVGGRATHDAAGLFSG